MIRHNDKASTNYNPAISKTKGVEISTKTGEGTNIKSVKRIPTTSQTP